MVKLQLGGRGAGSRACDRHRKHWQIRLSSACGLSGIAGPVVNLVKVNVGAGILSMPLCFLLIGHHAGLVRTKALPLPCVSTVFPI
eukprot:SAG22_NODE_5451_length_1012_cov_0.792990_1_plen_86_part_00